MFQVAILSVSSSFEDGILALAILDLRTLRPLAISGEIFPWFMMVPFWDCHSEGAARRICFSAIQSRSFASLRMTVRSFCAPDPAPQPVGRRRHIEVRDARLAKGVRYRVHERGERAAHARFADAFRAERVRGGRGRGLVDFEACNE